MSIAEQHLRSGLDEAPPRAPSPPARPAPPEPRKLKRNRPREFKPSDVAILLLAAAASYSIVWMLFTQLTLLSGALGFFVMWVPTFLFIYWAVNRQLFTRQVAIDRLIGALNRGAGCATTWTFDKAAARDRDFRELSA